MITGHTSAPALVCPAGEHAPTLLPGECACRPAPIDRRVSTTWERLYATLHAQNLQGEPLSPAAVSRRVPAVVRGTLSPLRRWPGICTGTRVPFESGRRCLLPPVFSSTIVSETPAAPKEREHARQLLTEHGIPKAHHLLVYAHQAAHSMAYHPQTFGGIVYDLPRTLTVYNTRATQTTIHQAMATALQLVRISATIITKSSSRRCVEPCGLRRSCPVV